MKLSIHDQEIAPALRKPWKNAIAVGRAAELLRQDVIDHLRFLQETVGYRHCRFHGLFHDEMAVVSRREDGSLAFRWHCVDKVYDALLQLGLKPFVELNPMPALLASGPETIFEWKMNVSPPRDYSEWEGLVSALVRHVADRYGVDEVAQWHFEVWNEPNLSGFWSGTKEEYWQLYAASARAVKGVSTRFRVGGPASSKACWIGEIIEHTSRNGIPLDFVSTHLYPQDEYVIYPDRQGSPHAPGEFFADTVRSVREEVAASARPDLPVHWTEWNSLSAASTAGISWTNNPTVDSLFSAGMICENCIALDDACDTLCWWVASDIFEESGMPHAEYSGTYGLVTIHGLPKASLHAFEFLNRLRGPRLRAEAEEALPPGCGWVVTREGETVRALFWCRILFEIPDQKPWRIEVTPPSRQDAWLGIETQLGAGRGSAWETWIDLGSPQNLSPEEMRLLRAHARPECRWDRWEIGQAQDLILQPGEVCLVELRPREATALPKLGRSEELAGWERKMSGVSKT